MSTYSKHLDNYNNYYLLLYLKIIPVLWHRKTERKKKSKIGKKCPLLRNVFMSCKFQIISHHRQWYLWIFHLTIMEMAEYSMYKMSIATAITLKLVFTHWTHTLKRLHLVAQMRLWWSSGLYNKLTQKMLQMLTQKSTLTTTYSRISCIQHCWNQASRFLTY